MPILRESYSPLFWSRMFSHICLHPDLHCPHRSQAPWAAPAEDPCWCPSMPPVDAHVLPRIWLHHLILPRQGDDTGWHPFQVCTSCCWGDCTQHYNSPCAHWNITQDIIPGTDSHRPHTMHTHWDHYCWLSRGPQGCPPWPAGLLELPWHHDSRGQHHPLHGKSILISTVEREEVLCQIHEGHQGITKCQLHAQNCVYWPGINKDIECVTEACEICQCFTPHQPQAPLKPTLPPIWTMATSWNWPIWVWSAWVPGHCQLLVTHAHHTESTSWTIQFIKGHLTLEGNVLWTWKPSDPGLW